VIVELLLFRAEAGFEPRELIGFMLLLLGQKSDTVIKRGKDPIIQLADERPVDFIDMELYLGAKHTQNNPDSRGKTLWLTWLDRGFCRDTAVVAV